MLNSFKTYIKKENLFSAKEKILLTVSGGVDSVLMVELFHLSGFDFGIAHCNFQLRGDDSKKDEAFVKSIAKKYNVAFHSIKFDTLSYSKTNKLSTQIAARELRYDWFGKLKNQFDYIYIATAHHQNDAMETVLINITRGTGISGLHGILPKKGAIIRPLLFTTKSEIEDYAKKHKIKFREDKSNASHKYVRNKIRLQVIPVLKELNPSIEKTIENNIKHFRDVETIFNNEVEKQRSKIVKPLNSGWQISIDLLNKLNPISIYLFEFLKQYNFNSSTTEDIMLSLNKVSGKEFFSDTHRLVKDRAFLFIEKIATTNQTKHEIKKYQSLFDIDGLQLKFTKQNGSIIDTNKSAATLDFDKLEFPLEIRRWKDGDTFHPLGMNSKKKLSDFFIDKKLSLIQKENTWILTSQNKIVWVIGQRIDNRFKVTDKTKNTLLINLV